MDVAPLRGQVAREMAMAEEAGAAGREGRARVCSGTLAPSPRCGGAAGLAAMHYLKRTRQPRPAQGALDGLSCLSELEDLPDQLRRAASRLITRVTEVHELPRGEDPLVEARVVIIECLGDEARHG